MAVELSGNSFCSLFEYFGKKLKMRDRAEITVAVRISTRFLSIAAIPAAVKERSGNKSSGEG